MIIPCTKNDREDILSIINEAAQAYRGVIPADCFHEPYMSHKELAAEIEKGVEFWGWRENEKLVGIMGIQSVRDATLVRHAYVSVACQGRGIGGAILEFFMAKTTGVLLVGTWAAAHWAIGLYQKHGFRLVSQQEKQILLQNYWTVSPRQIEASVVLVYS